MLGFAPDTSQAFALKMGLGFAAGGFFILWAALQQPGRPIFRWSDVYLGTILGGIIGARVFFVLVHAAQFAGAPAHIPRLWYGGLSWQGAILGGLVGMVGLCRWRAVDVRAFSDALALAFPVGVMAFAWAARSAGLMIGYPVADLAAEPVWKAAYLPDLGRDVIPRYELQMLGLAMGGTLLILATVLTLANRLQGRRLALILGLAGGCFAVLGHHSAMPAVAWLGLSSDVWGAGILVMLGVAGLAWPKRSLNTPSHHGQDGL
ncbi:MAG: prolipoprotein diacylglyceryl transferase family protein [Anaerolineales bacterium]